MVLTQKIIYFHQKTLLVVVVLFLKPTAYAVTLRVKPDRSKKQEHHDDICLREKRKFYLFTTAK